MKLCGRKFGFDKSRRCISERGHGSTQSDGIFKDGGHDDGLRHATSRAIAWIVGGADLVDFFYQLACDWTLKFNERRDFSTNDAKRLVEGYHTDLPVCPTCAMFVDAALAVRAEKEQQHFDAERARQKGAA